MIQNENVKKLTVKGSLLHPFYQIPGKYSLLFLDANETVTKIYSYFSFKKKKKKERKGFYIMYMNHTFFPPPTEDSSIFVHRKVSVYMSVYVCTCIHTHTHKHI